VKKLLMTTCILALTSVSWMPALSATSTTSTAAAASQEPPPENLRGYQDPTTGTPTTTPSNQPPGSTPSASNHPQTVDDILNSASTSKASLYFPGRQDPGEVAVTPSPAARADADHVYKGVNEIPHDTTSPYRDALNCVASQLTDQQRMMGWSVGDIPDRTGQINMVADAGTGTFSTQAANDLMLTSLAKTGVIVVDSGQVFQQRVDWYMGKATANLIGDGNTYVSHDPKTGTVESTQSIGVWPGTIMPMRYMVQGAISSLDFVPGGGITANAGPIQGQHIKNAMRIGIDMHVTQMPVGRELGGQVVAAERVEREAEATENQLGLSSFFRSANYYALSVGSDKRQALQSAEAALFDRFAAVLVAKVNHISGCQAQLDYDDGLAFSAP
jgi:hypothetical protein